MHGCRTPATCLLVAALPPVGRVSRAGGPIECDQMGGMVDSKPHFCKVMEYLADLCFKVGACSMWWACVVVWSGVYVSVVCM